jgi:hypothetical protein
MIRVHHKYPNIYLNKISEIGDDPTVGSSRIVNRTIRSSSLNGIDQTIEFHKTQNMKLVHIDELSMTEQIHAPVVTGCAATRRRRRRVAPPSNFSDGYEIFPAPTSQQAQQHS